MAIRAVMLQFLRRCVCESFLHQTRCALRAVYELLDYEERRVLISCAKSILRVSFKCIFLILHHVSDLLSSVTISRIVNSRPLHVRGSIEPLLRHVYFNSSKPRRLIVFILKFFQKTASTVLFFLTQNFN